jgi:hypothetical protein
MRATVAIVAAFASLAVAAPGYYGEKPAEETPCTTETPAPSTVPAYPVETPSVSKSVPGYPEETPSYPTSTPSKPEEEYPVSTPSKPEEEYPAETPSKPEEEYPTKPEEEYPTKPEEEYPTKPTKTPEYPTEPEEEYPAEETCLSSTTVTVTIPHGTGYPHGPKPTESPYYPIPPKGTGYPPAPPKGTGYPTSTGGYTKPTAPTTPEFEGAASSLNVAGFVAGVGAFAALFL